MILARVEGNVVATKKSDKMTGSKFLIVRPILVKDAKSKELVEGSQTLVATDPMGAGEGELVLIVQGSSARLAGDSNLPVDAVVIGIVDTVDVGKEILYKAK